MAGIVTIAYVSYEINIIPVKKIRKGIRSERAWESRAR